MVLSEKNSNSLRNGQRSRGPSPNGNGGVSSPASPMDEDGEKIRVGRDYQAICPELINPVERKPPQEVSDRALLVWSPSREISDDELDRYMQVAKEKYGYNGEQALGMLFWHKHDLEKAVLDLANFTPFPDEWTVEDKVLFEQAFNYHGKTFHRIKQMLPDKTMSSLVKYYYTWKKTRGRTSLMDRQARKNATAKEDVSEQGSEGDAASDHADQAENSDSDIEQNKKDQEQEDKEPHCQNCGIPCSLCKPTPKGSVCTTCYIHWRKTGNMRPTIGPLRSRDRHCYTWLKKKWRPPRGIHIDHDDLVALSTESEATTSLFVSLDREVASLKRQVQHNKQVMSNMKKKNCEVQDDIRAPDGAQKTHSRWTHEESSLAVQGVRKYGKNFKAIADVIGTKTEAHVRSFFLTYRKKYNLDNVLKEYHAENLTDENTPSKMDVESEIVGEMVASAQ